MPSTKSFTLARILSPLRFNTTKRSNTVQSSSDRQVVRMLQTVKQATMTNMTATEIRVDVFECVKHDSNSPMKNNNIDHISNAHGRLKTIAIDSLPKRV